MSSSKTSSNTYTIIFMMTLCFICAFFLSILATSLEPLQNKAKQLDKSKQLLIAAKVLNSQGYFQIQITPSSKDTAYKIPVFTAAKYDAKLQKLVKGLPSDLASDNEIATIFKDRVHSMLVDEQGNEYSFSELKINLYDYLDDHEKMGFANLRHKLVYKVTTNSSPEKKVPSAIAYVLPVNGMGLWDKIYGYLAISSDGNHVIGTTWYDQKETAGLGANIATPAWQTDFLGKVIFMEDAAGTTNFQTAPLGINVVRGKVKDVYPSSSKANSAVDGISGATLTGNGVTKAYKNSLTPYRNFFIKLNKQYKTVKN